jgi:hypothetical protein
MPYLISPTQAKVLVDRKKKRSFPCAACPTQEAFSQDRKYDSLDLDRVAGCIRDKQHAYSQDGGDSIEIDIPNRRIHLAISDAEMAKHRAAMEARGSAAWKPQNRARKVLAALQAYAAMTTSADTSAVRDVSRSSK